MCFAMNPLAPLGVVFEDDVVKFSGYGIQIQRALVSSR